MKGGAGRYRYYQCGEAAEKYQEHAHQWVCFPSNLLEKQEKVTRGNEGLVNISEELIKARTKTAGASTKLEVEDEGKCRAEEYRGRLGQRNSKIRALTS